VAHCALASIPRRIAQETWLRALRSLDTFDPHHGRFRPWLLGIARNVLLESLHALRSQRRRQRFDDARPRAGGPSRSESPARRAGWRATTRCNASSRASPQLGEDEQVLVLARGLEGLSAAEAALRPGHHAGCGREALAALASDALARDLPP
jgi:DNA-directed RNA polymerase specialized sigma24 family protein